MENLKVSRFRRLFGMKADTSVKTEIIAGLTTFFAMCYIIMVNPSTMTGTNDDGSIMFQGLWNATYVGTIIAAVIGTLLYAFLAKKPFAQASGMGLNAFFFVSFIVPALGKYTTDAEMAKNYGAGLVIILISGLIFLILSVTGLRSYIAKSLPDCLKKAIPAGIGLFIALLGLKGAGFVVADKYTLVAFGDMRSWVNVAPVLAAGLGLIAIVIFN